MGLLRILIVLTSSFNANYGLVAYWILLAG